MPLLETGQTVETIALGLGYGSASQHGPIKCVI